MTTNKFPGRCVCGIYVQPTQGYVHNRKIMCIQCVSLAPGRPTQRPAAFDYYYQGCGPESEHLDEWFADHFDNESHFVGWEVGDQ